MSTENTKTAPEAMWQSLVTAQLAQIEGMLQRIDTTMKAQLTKSRDQLEEVNRMTQSALTWASELQQGAVELALNTLKTAQNAFHKTQA